MMLLLNTLTTVCIGLLIGTEFAVSAFINPVLWKLEERRRHERSVYLQPNWGRSCLFGMRSVSCFCLSKRLSTAMDPANHSWLLPV